MLNFLLANRISRFSVSFLLAAFALAGCGGGGGGAGGGTTPPPATPVAVVNAIALGTSVNAIPTDNLTTATLTATLTDAANALMTGVPVTFSSTSGNLSATTVTSAAGKATVTLTSGILDASNRTATITATAGGKTATIPVLINGSTLTLAPSATTVQVGVGTITATATAKDAALTGKNGQSIRFSIGAASTGAGTLSAPATLTTGPTGATTAVTFTPTAAGNVVLTADWLDATGAVSVTATSNITVTAVGIPFAVTTPATDPWPLATNAVQALAVTVPATIGVSAVASVRISSTAGTWTGLNPVAAAAASIIQTPVANAVAATYTASANSGVVTVQVDALDAANAVLSTLTRSFVVSAPAAAATTLVLQSSVATIVPSSGTNISTATLTATVRAGLNAVGNAAVMFELLGTTGSGESISPAVAYTSASGIATATFRAGSLPTLGPIYARARVVGQVCAGIPPAIDANLLCSSTPMTVTAGAVSVTIGTGTTISDTANATQYLLPLSVLAVNSNGSAAAGATVSLTVFPYQYRNGSITQLGAGCIPPVTTFVASEDVNRNGVLDAGEDTPLVKTAAQTAAGAISLNGVLSPPQAAGGIVPTTVITDANGTATFNLQYPKSSALFIKDELTARVVVPGSEGTAQTTFVLPMSAADATAPTCPLANTSTY